MSKRYRIAIAAAWLTLAGCGQSPFPAQKLEPLKQPSPHAEGYAITCEEVMEFSEGRLAEYVVDATVPAPGVPVITVEGLPDGAQYVDGRIRWTPAPGTATKKFRIKLTLGSSLDASVSIAKNAMLLVDGGHP